MKFSETIFVLQLFDGVISALFLYKYLYLNLFMMSMKVSSESSNRYVKLIDKRKCDINSEK